MASAPSFSWAHLGLVAAGGALGASARGGLVWLAGDDLGTVSLTTLAINVMGSLALGIVVGALGDRHPGPRLFLGTGVLGGFTTYSALAVQATQLAAAAPLLAMLIPLASLVVGVLAAGGGLVIGRLLAGRAGAVDDPKSAE